MVDSSVAIPTVVFLTSDPNDIEHANCWQNSFEELIPIFQTLGIRVLSAPWSTSPDPNNPSSFIYVANLVWGYHCVPDRWNAWLDAWPDNIRLINSKKLLKWNTDKIYLQDLEAHGVPIVPTLYTNDINETTLINAAAHFNVTELVVKPVISASSRNTFRISVGPDDLTSASSINEAILKLKQNDSLESMMIQPFISNVLHEGEISVIVFNGKVNHAVRKVARQDDFRVQSEYGGTYSVIEYLSPEILSLAQTTIAACPEMPIYARIDMIRNDKTNILSIMELELIEPFLFLNHSSDKGLVFARAIVET